MNHVSLVGRIGQEPEVRYFESGTVKTTISVAVKPPYASETPLWFKVECWGNLAETVGNYLSKGRLVAIYGDIKIESWTDRTTGEHRQKVVVRANSVDFLDKKAEVAATV
jgi:single-strand DNA-binding protein